MNKQALRKMAQECATFIGTMLNQSYQEHEGGWWLVTNGKRVRPLRPDEVEWHVKRKHAPFVPDGVWPDDPRWWNDVV